MHMEWDGAGDGHLWHALVAAQSELGQGVAIVDIETQRYVFVNDALSLMYGYSVEEMLALPSFYAIVHPEDVPALEPDRVVRAAGGEPATDRYQTRIVHKDGSLIEIEVGLKPLSTLPGSRAIVLVRDVTEQRRREQDLSAAEQKYR